MLARRRKIFILLIFLLLIVDKAFAFWVWTPETNRWENPKYSVKESPAEQLEYAINFYKSKQYKEAVREFSKLLHYYPRAREAPDAQYYIGLCYEEQDKPAEAFKNYQMVIDKYPFSDRSNDIVQREYDIGVGIMEGKSKHGKFMEALTGNDYDVIEVFRKVIKNAPYGKLAAPAQYKIGLYLLGKGLYQEARDEFEKVVNDYPDSEWAKAAKFQIATADARRSTGAQYDQRTTKAAADQFKEFVENNPDAELSSEAKKQIQELREKEAKNNFLIAEYYEKQKNYKSAKIYYQSILDDYQNTSFASRALEKIRGISEKGQ